MLAQVVCVCVLREGSITRACCAVAMEHYAAQPAAQALLLTDLSAGPVRRRRASCIYHSLGEDGPGRWRPAVTIASDISNFSTSACAIAAARRSAAVALAAVALAVVVAVVDQRQDVSVAELSVHSSELQSDAALC
jgi:hypothetical protein